MGTETEILSFKQEALEKDNISIKNDIKDIKSILSRVETKLNALPNEPQCPLHNLRMNQFEEKIKIMESKLENVNNKIISWSAIAAVILFIISSFLVPYLQKHMSEPAHTHTPAVGMIEPYDRFPNPSPMPFLYSTNITSLLAR